MNNFKNYTFLRFSFIQRWWLMNETFEKRYMKFFSFQIFYFGWQMICTSSFKILPIINLLDKKWNVDIFHNINYISSTIIHACISKYSHIISLLVSNVMFIIFITSTIVILLHQWMPFVSHIMYFTLNCFSSLFIVLLLKEMFNSIS